MTAVPATTITLTRAKLIPVVEVFGPTIQGEGAEAGGAEGGRPRSRTPRLGGRRRSPLAGTASVPLGGYAYARWTGRSRRGRRALSIAVRIGCRRARARASPRVAPTPRDRL